MSPLSSVFRRPVSAAESPTDAHAPRTSDDLSSGSETRVSDIKASTENGKGYKVPSVHIGTTKESLLAGGRRFNAKVSAKFRERAKTYGVLDWAAMILPCITWLRTYRWRSWIYVRLWVVCWKLIGHTPTTTERFHGWPVSGSNSRSPRHLVRPACWPSFRLWLVWRIRARLDVRRTRFQQAPGTQWLHTERIFIAIHTQTCSYLQAVGPVAVTSMILFSGINNNIFRNPNDNYNTPTEPEAQQTYNIIAIQVAFLAGILYSAFGFLRLGWLTQFVSHAVIAGFTTGAATTIALSQVCLRFSVLLYVF